MLARQPAAKKPDSETQRAELKTKNEEKKKNRDCEESKSKTASARRAAQAEREGCAGVVVEGSRGVEARGGKKRLSSRRG